MTMTMNNRPPLRFDPHRPLAARLRLIRTERFGEHGGAELARLLGLPAGTWANYERGVIIPGDVLLRFLTLTAAEPHWLLHGEGPKYRDRPADRSEDGIASH